MADPVTLAVGSTLLSAGMKIAGQYAAGQAAEAEAKFQQGLLERKREAERKAQKENVSRAMDDKRRAMARLQAQQAARGFAGGSTQLAVFGEIEDRYDERINEMTNQSLDRIGAYQDQSAMIGFQSKQQKKATQFGMIGTAVKGVTTAGIRGYEFNKQYGDDPFKIF